MTPGTMKPEAAIKKLKIHCEGMLKRSDPFQDSELTSASIKLCDCLTLGSQTRGTVFQVMCPGYCQIIFIPYNVAKKLC